MEGETRKDKGRMTIRCEGTSAAFHSGITERNQAGQLTFDALATLAIDGEDAGGHIPSNVRGYINTVLVGCIWLDSFAGRMWEWETMEVSHVQDFVIITS
eukprot:3802548-Amphidinium_carterae.1